MKIAGITILLGLFCSNMYGQNASFLTGKRKDSIWIKQLIENQRKEQATVAKKDSSSQYVEWAGGKVVYSPDSCLRIAQLSGSFPNSQITNYTTTVQYLCQNKVIELKLPGDSADYDFRDYPISNIYKLPYPNATYLILSTKTDTLLKATLYQQDGAPITRPADQDSVYKKMDVIASLVHVVNDSLVETGFETGEDNNKRPFSEIISGNSLCAGLDTWLTTMKDGPRPFIKYDPAKKELSFLTLSCSDDDGSDNDGKGCSDPYLNVYSGLFKYKDSAFTLLSDTGYFYPRLESLDEIIAAKNFKTGTCITRVRATTKYEQVGEGVLQALHVDYYVQSQNISYVDYLNDDPRKPDLKPDYKVQKDGSLIFLITDSTTPNHSGSCGGCEYFDSEFWLIKRKTKELLFTFSSNSNTGYTTYSFKDGNADRSGRFYLEKKPDDDDERPNAAVDNMYWKGNSTYVFHVSDETSGRNFYVHFVKIGNKTIAKLTAGKLVHRKGS